MKKQSAAKAALARHKAAVEKAASGLSVTDELRWIPRGSVWQHHAKPIKLLSKLELVANRAVLSDAAAASWWNSLSSGTQSAVNQRRPNSSKPWALRSANPRIARAASSLRRCLIWLSEPVPFCCSRQTLRSRRQSHRLPRGLPIRGPTALKAWSFASRSRMRLLICEYSTQGCATTNAKSVSAEQWVPQAGAYRLLPFRNLPFEAATLSADFREDGRMETFSYERTKAPASGIDSLANRWSPLRPSATSARKRPRKNGEKLALRSLPRSITTSACSPRKRSSGSPTPGDQQKKQYENETARLNAEIALLNAQRSKLEAEALLAVAAGS